MKLRNLLTKVDVEKIVGNSDVDIKSIDFDSKIVGNGSLFVCIKGGDFDGHDFVNRAEVYGAVAIVCERELKTSLTQIIVKDSRKALSVICGNFYDNVHKKMKIIGITGTNGKTTTATLIKSVLCDAGIECGVIGTLGAFYKDKHINSTLTTPDPTELHKIFSEMYKSGVKVVVMEVSAHSIDLRKIEGINFEIGVFTNFTRDHLDYFKSMENYKKSKLKFFDRRCKYVVANSDDELGREIIKNNAGVISYGINNPADVFAMDVNCQRDGTDYIINLFDEIYDFSTPLLGEFNVSNVLATCTVSALMGVKTDQVIKSLKNIKGVDGRLEKIYDGNFSVFVDYAHTPDGLKKVLSTLKKTCLNRLICVFGCGGNRDVDKREIMGEISGGIADFTIITSDNPRFEEPMKIIQDIEKGVLTKTKNFVAIEERVEAIKYALNFAKTGDVVLVAGKGAENYQEVLGIKHPYNDKDIIINILGKK